MNENQQALPKAPKLLDPSGRSNPYDWREFDRFLQRLFALLGNVTTAEAVNIFNATLSNTSYMQTPISAQSTITTTQDTAHTDEVNVFATAAPESSVTTYDQSDSLTLYWIGV